MNLALAESLAGFEALTDDKTGIIQSVSLIHRSENDPDVFVAYADPCDTEALTGLSAANRGAACSPLEERAILRACGESVERYCSAVFAVEDLRLATAEELVSEGSFVVEVGDVYPFSDAQYEEPDFPYERTTGRSLRWVRGTSAVSDEPWWVPASCVYVPYLFDRAVEPFTHMPISTGLAAGRSREDCIRKGILEILERDALMIVWDARLPVPRIDPGSCKGFSPVVDALLEVGRTGAEWHLNLLTLDIEVPIVSAALIDPADPPRTSFGIAAHPDPVHAVMLALEEAALTRVLVNRTLDPNEQLDPDHDLDTSAIRTLRDHMLVHARSSALRGRLDFLERGPVESLESLLERASGAGLDAPLERVAAAGFDPIWVDVTTEDVAPFGFHVVRTVVAGMQPLDNDHRHRYLGGTRRVAAPRAAGFGDVLESNPDPHPFP